MQRSTKSHYRWRGPDMKNILLIEDEENLINIMASVLEDEGFSVRKLLTAEEALDMCSSYSPDLIISDVRMKEMDGFTMFEKMKTLQSLRSTPFIFLTALDDRASQQRALQLGATAYITKPFDVDELLGVVRKALPAA
jgi:CheY-like chemotaxis protein